VWAAAGGGAAWLLGSGALWRVEEPAGAGGARLSLAELSAEVAGGWRGLLPAADGGLALWGARGLATLSARRAARWSAGRPGALREEPTPLTLSLDDPAEAAAAWWWVDAPARPAEGEGLRALPLAPGAAAVSIALSNLDLTAGERALYAEVQYRDGEVARAELRLRVAPVTTWSRDISVIHAERCAACHSGTGARDLRGAAQWRLHIDDILFVTRMRSMPLGAPPLSEALIERLEGWRLGGFQE